MGARGELFTTDVMLENRTYFFNVKENRAGDVFLQVVESKNRDGENFERHAIVVFADDMQKFFRGVEDSLAFIDKARKARPKAAAEKKLEKNAKSGAARKIYRKTEKAPRQESEKTPPKRVRVISKKS